MGSELRGVCVVIGVRNGERFLDEAIASVLAQTHRRLELRIYDNRSHDRSAAIARAHLSDPRVSYTLNDDDLGTTAASTAGCGRRSARRSCRSPPTT
jgi:glycosyltransferase involved in cell wall biosynthesis